MDKNILIKNEAKQKLIVGVNKLADAVKVTMGPQGKLVVIEDINNIAPKVTKDGVTVASYVDLEDSFENQGAMILKQASKVTVDEVNDSTTTSTVLAQALVNNGANSGKSYRQLSKEYYEGLEKVKTELIKLSKKGKVKDVAKIAANGDEKIAKLVAKAFSKSKLITTETSVDKNDHLVYDEGSQIDSGVVSQAFKDATLGESLVIIFNKKLTDLREIVGVLEHAVSNNLGVLLVVDEYEDKPMYEIMYNKANSNLNITVIHMPNNREEWFEDIKVATGAVPYTELTEGQPGKVDKVVSNVEKTSFTISKDRLKEVKQYVKTLTDKRRIANLTTGIVTLKIGGVSSAETAERLDRVDDAVGAVSSSYKYGVIPGGGNTLAYLAETLDLSEEFKNALKAPKETILENAEYSDPNKVEFNKGLDVATGIYTEDLIGTGIVDSTEGIIKALESAVSVANIILQTNGLILTINGDV